MMADTQAEMREKKKRVLPTGNAEIDKKLADGLPLNSLNLLEGANDTGKSVLCQQIVWGGMNDGLSAAIFTSEYNSHSLLHQMEELGMDVSDYFAWGYLKIYPIDLEGVKWTEELSKNFLLHMIDCIREAKEELIVIDSFTPFTFCASQESLFNFFTECKSECDRGKTVIITLHSYAFDEDTLTRIRSIADGHIKLRLETVGDKNVGMMEVVKMRGAKKVAGNMVSFEVHPGYGLKVVPYSSISV
ncbi:MAG TPA: ATPase domain-containing protein [Methanocella sp.]|uniref:PRK06067 family protein n=1 Tax=Methanocella sp. TaxID=2052833 RepID=UPI002C5A8F82|nr:ATPase domain-containing protein [Methanocella sp.]HTY89695.1 ATPase domain-containing protein [Methanocella sp.]